MKVGVTIVYSAQDDVFLNKLIFQVLEFSRCINIVYVPKYFDGSDYPKTLNFNSLKGMVKTTGMGEIINLIEIPYKENKLHVEYYYQLRSSGFADLKERDCDYILFLDGDEIPEGSRMKEFLSYGLSHDSYKIANYVYYAKPIYQAKAIQDSAIMINTKTYKPEDLNKHLRLERDNLVNNYTQRNVTYKGKPLIHHFSWAKPLSALQKKIETWGHNNDMDWKPIIKHIKTFNGTTKDKVWGYNYKQVDNLFNLKFNED